MAKFKAMFLSYARAAIAAAVALYLSGEHDVKKLSAAALAGFLGPILKALDPNATEFGIGAK